MVSKHVILFWQLSAFKKKMSALEDESRSCSHQSAEVGDGGFLRSCWIGWIFADGLIHFKKHKDIPSCLQVCRVLPGFAFEDVLTRGSSSDWGRPIPTLRCSRRLDQETLSARSISATSYEEACRLTRRRRRVGCLCLKSFQNVLGIPMCFPQDGKGSV